MSERKVFCIDRKCLFSNGSFFNGFCGAGLYRLPQAAKDSAHFRDKDDAEKDASHKQIIPYVSIFCPEKASFLVYKRGKTGGEGRLHDLMSAGFGGHIEPHDRHAGDDFGWVVARAMDREIQEELDFRGTRPSFIGYLNNEDKLVNQVHLGLVHNLIVGRDQASAMLAAEDCIEGLELVNVNDLSQNLDRFETWSQFMLSAYFANPSLYTMSPSPY